VTLPLFHVGGMWMGILNSVEAVATAAVPGRFSASRFWDEVRDFGATYALLVGAIGNILIRQPPSERDRDHSLRTVYIAPVMDEVHEFEERFGVEVCTGYGMTEANGVLGAAVGRARPKSCGWLRPGYQARIVGPDDVEVPNGEAGELILRSDEPWRFAVGYCNLPEATNELFRNQWLHTGDVFRRTPEGEYLFVDRKKDAIRRRGENVSSFEVEAEANRFPAVLETAAIGVPSALGEEDICLVVVPRDEGFDAGELVRHLASRMPHFMVPRYVVTAPDGLPRSATDKIQKARLRADVDLTTAWDKEQHDSQLAR
jgi:crotonobetaine/carnitine-CoA ligase